MNKHWLIALAPFAIGAAARAETAEYHIDPTHTSVSFEVLHNRTSTLRGRFDRKQGSVSFDKAAKTGRAEITIDMNSVSTGVPPRDSHLKGKDFFNTAAQAQASFVADRFVFDGDQLSEIVGSLTLLGKTQPLTLKATNFNCYLNPLFKREVCGGDFETTLVRSQYGMSYGLNHGLPDDIRLLIQIEAIKQ